jgi:dTDP-4-dehydrorhamnose reductase
LRILVTGWHSQIAQALVERAPADPAVSALALGRPALELCRPSGISGAMMAGRPDVIVNAAAYTRVDKAERDRARAWAQNRDGAAEIARVAAARDVPLIHISSVYVFDGEKETPYTEDDPPAPQSVYGRTRLAGEEAVAAANPRHVILRTGWVFSEFGSNFVTRMLARAPSEEAVEVVDDQAGSPTWTGDLAEAILAIAARVTTRGDDTPWGTYHVAGAGHATWFALAERLFAVSNAFGGPTARVVPMTAEDYPTSAPRLANARLDCARAKSAFDVALPPWERGLETCVARLLDKEPHP